MIERFGFGHHLDSIQKVREKTVELKQASVLVVEDEPVMRRYVVDTLRRIGIENVLEAEEGVDGLQKARSARPDVVITDIHMEPMNGMEFVRSMRSVPGLRDMPVIMMSADSSRDTLGAAIDLQVDSYVVKPPRWQDLERKIEEALGA